MGWEAHSPRSFTKMPPCLSGKAEHGGHYLSLRAGGEGCGGVGWGGGGGVCVCRPLWQGPGGLLQAGGPSVVSHSEWPSLKGPFFIFIALRVYAIYPFLHWLGQKVHSLLSKTKRHISFSPRLYWTMYSLTKRTFWPSQYMWNLKYDTNEPIYENRNRIMDIGNRQVVAKGWGTLGGRLELADISYCT